jgi:hypothetical protein
MSYDSVTQWYRLTVICHEGPDRNSNLDSAIGQQGLKKVALQGHHQLPAPTKSVISRLDTNEVVTSS